MVEEIVEFVRDGLGCQCPPEVFQTITVSRDPEIDELAPGSRLIRVGGRLLVLLLPDPDLQALPATLVKLVDTGRRLRDREGYNRLRLVIAAPEPTVARHRFSTLFAAAARGDERLHLHIVEPSELPDLEKQA